MSAAERAFGRDVFDPAFSLLRSACAAMGVSPAPRDPENHAQGSQFFFSTSF